MRALCCKAASSRASGAALDDRLRASRRAALNANLDTLRAAQEEAQREDREFIERARAAARSWRDAARARRAEASGGVRGAYERRVHLLLIGTTPPRRSRVRAAADRAAANSGPIGTHELHSGEDEVHRASADARTASPLLPHSAD